MSDIEKLQELIDEPMFKDIKELKNLNFQGMDLVNKALNKKYVEE